MLNDSITVGTSVCPVVERNVGPNGLTIRKNTTSVTVGGVAYKKVTSLSIGQQPTKEGTRTLIRIDESYTPSTTAGMPFKQAAQLVLVSNSPFPLEAYEDTDVLEANNQPEKAGLDALGLRLIDLLLSGLENSLQAGDEVTNAVTTAGINRQVILARALQRLVNGED